MWPSQVTAASHSWRRKWHHTGEPITVTPELTHLPAVSVQSSFDLLRYWRLCSLHSTTTIRQHSQHLQPSRSLNTANTNGDCLLQATNMHWRAEKVKTWKSKMSKYVHSQSNSIYVFILHRQMFKTAAVWCHSLSLWSVVREYLATRASVLAGKNKMDNAGQDSANLYALTRQPNNFLIHTPHNVVLRKKDVRIWSKSMHADCGK